MDYVKRIKKYVKEMKTDISFSKSYLIRSEEIRLTQKKLAEYKDIHKGKDFAIIATGPSLSDYKPIEGCIYIGVNKAYKSELPFSYYFIQDYYAIQGYIEEIIKNIKCPTFVGKYIMEEDCYYVQTPEKYIQLLNANAYFTAWPTDEIFPDITVSPLANCGTVTFAAMQFALLCGARKVYLVGCDTTSGGYFDGTKQKNVKVIDTSYLINNYKKMKKFVDVYYPESEIVSINPVGLKGIFQDIYQ